MCGFVFGRGVSIRCLMRNQIYYRGATFFFTGVAYRVVPFSGRMEVKCKTLCLYVYIEALYRSRGQKKYVGFRFVLIL